MKPTSPPAPAAISPTPPTSAWALVGTIASTGAICLSTIYAISPTPQAALLLLAPGLPRGAATVFLGTMLLPRVRPARAGQATVRSGRVRGNRSWRLATEIAAALGRISVGLFAQSPDASCDAAIESAAAARQARPAVDDPVRPSRAAPIHAASAGGRIR